MEQHPIPRQVTTFEFKLIGFMTLKQFFAVLGATPIAYIVFWLVGVFPLNAIAGGVVMLVGAAIAFVPINDRPMTVFLANLWRRINSPTQYVFKRHIVPYDLLSGLVFVANPHQTLAHIESKEKLQTYLNGLNKKTDEPKQKNILHLFNQTQNTSKLVQPPQTQNTQTTTQQQVSQQTVVQTNTNRITYAPGQPATQQSHTEKPFLSGVVKNKRGIQLPGVLVYVKDTSGKVVRILKANAHGIFATFHPLSPGPYVLEVAQGSMEYVFAPQNIVVSGEGQTVELVSQEVFR